MEGKAEEEKVSPSEEIIGVNHPAIVREIPHFDFLPAFLQKTSRIFGFRQTISGKKSNSLNIPIIFSATKMFCG